MENILFPRINSFLLLLALVTIAFFWILLPYSGAVFWGVVFAIVFAPSATKIRRCALARSP